MVFQTILWMAQMTIGGHMKETVDCNGKNLNDATSELICAAFPKGIPDDIQEGPGLVTLLKENDG